MKTFRFPEPTHTGNCIVVETIDYRFYIALDEWINQGGE